MENSNKNIINMEKQPLVVSTKKYSAIDMFKCMPEFQEEGRSCRVKVASDLLPQEFFTKCAKLFPTANCEEDEELKQKLKEAMFEKAQKKHKNYLRRQRAKQAKIAQKERDLQEIDAKKQNNNQETAEEVKNITANKFDTLSMAGSDSGVSIKSGNSTKAQKIKKTNKNVAKVKTVQKFTVLKSQVATPETNYASPEISTRQPTFYGNGLRGSNFRNQGKLRASTDDQSVIGSGSSSSSVFAAKPISEPRTWSNSRLHKNRQPRGRIGSRS